VSLVESIRDFIEKHPKFVEEHPEYNSIAGFIDKSTRIQLQELKEQEVKA
jgi:hypothetical protein